MRAGAIGRRPAPPGPWMLAALALCGAARAQTAVPDGEFIYHARLHDTLIGIGRRLLLEPRRWSEVQTRNRIANPRRIPPGSSIRIPFSWLRLSTEAATVTAVSGTVRLGEGTVEPGTRLAEGSRIETGSDGSVTLQLADGSLITLQKSGTLTLQEMRGVSGVAATHDTRLRLDSGRLQTVVKPQGDDGRFEIVTPVAVSAVRGTQFRSAFDPASADATTETLEGLVGVAGAAATVSLPADFGTRVPRNGVPLPPTQLLPPPDLSALPGTNGGGRLRRSWPVVAGATGYRVQLAPDAGFRSFLADLQTATPEIDLPAPADGSWFLRVRSIDRFALEGRDAVRPLVQRLLPGAPVLAAPAAGGSLYGDSATLAWNGSESGIRYRVQVARDAVFGDLLLDRDAGAVTHADLDRVPPGRWYWRVAGVNERGEGGEWSAPRSFVQRAAAPAPRAPTFADHRLRLDWDPRPEVRYQLQIARDPKFQYPLLDRTLDVPELSLRTPRPGTYYARIRIVADDGSASPFGATGTFEVPVPRWLKILLPLLTLLTLVR